MLSRASLAGLILLPAAPGAGKTLVAGAIADWFRRRGSRVAVSVPIATGAARRREGLVSQEAEFLAACAEARHPLDLICPLRYADDSIPYMAAKRSGERVDWKVIDRSLALMSRDSDVLIVQAPAPLMTPLDEGVTTLDMARWLGAGIVLVSRPGLAQVHHCMLNIATLRGASVPTAGIVVNRYPAENPSTDEEASLREIEKWTKTPVLCVVPEERVSDAQLGEGITGAMDLVDWPALAQQRGVVQPREVQHNPQRRLRRGSERPGGAPG